MASHSQTILTAMILPLAMMMLMASWPRPSLAVGLCNQDDEAALLQMKAQLSYPPVLSSWDSNTDCCVSWEGVSCNADNRVEAVSIKNDDDANGSIAPEISKLTYLVALTLVNLPYLGGELPATITQLTNLAHLEIRRTQLYGQLPANLDHLTNLKNVHMSHNKLSGPIPDSLGQLMKLRSLHLSHNQLSGPIPKSLGQLTKLRELHLSHNQLSGPIPKSLVRLMNLHSMKLSYNQLSGPIPASFGNLPKLYELSLDNNQLNGSIPESMANLNLKSVDLSQNSFVGDASVLFSGEKQTTALNISRNQFSFNMSSVVFPPDLNVLDISFNNIFSTIPAQLGDLPLQAFNVRNNLLWGEIPRIKGNPGPSAFDYNTCLCGSPLPGECPCCLPTSSGNPTAWKLRMLNKIRPF